MNDKKIMVLKVEGEVFLLGTTDLTRDEIAHIESIASSVSDDFSDEVENMSVYELCGWFQTQVKAELGVELENVGIAQEINIDR